jgi:hypothetical protein
MLFTAPSVWELFFMLNSLVSEIITQKKASADSQQTKQQVWDMAEQLLHGQLNDSISLEGQSKVFDPKLATLLIERSYRVMAQLATGKVKGISTNDMADAKLKNLLLDKYVIPNANAQFDFLTKLRMVDLYSNAYGDFYVLVDQDVKGNGYIGPDMWLLNRRDVFPQVGAVGDDGDQIIVRTWKPISYFEGLKPGGGYKNISQIITILKDLSGSKQIRDTSNMSKREQDQYPNQTPAKNLGYFEVLTRFEKDRWVDVCIDADLEFRDQKNPQDNDELPVVKKYSIPLLDDRAGLGDMERGGSMQMAINSNWNLYFDALKISVNPPIILNKDNVASMSSFQPIPGAQWLGRGNVNDIAQAVNLNPKGVETFNNTYQVANAALQGLFGTSDTTISKDIDNTQGKTPQALKMQSQRENTRDNADRFYMEQFVSKVMKRMVNLMNKKQSSSVSFRMFPDEIEKLTREYPEIKDTYDEKNGKLTVKPGKSSAVYDWEIVSGSTYALDQKDQQANLEMMLNLWLQTNTPQGNILENTLKANGYTFKFGELFKRLISNGGIQDWDKILEEMTPQEQGQQTLDTHAAQFQQVLSQMQGGGMSQVPPMPNGQAPGQPMPPQQMPQGPMPPQGVSGGM